jgi:hypothetical protein
LCAYLFERMTIASNRQIRALTHVTDAVIDEPDNDAKIEALKRTLKILSLSRKEAVDRYESHLLTHVEKTVSTGR